VKDGDYIIARFRGTDYELAIGPFDSLDSAQGWRVEAMAKEPQEYWAFRHYKGKPWWVGGVVSAPKEEA
jgi:hypothetical protein